jgi:hypothetical protein
MRRFAQWILVGGLLGLPAATAHAVEARCTETLLGFTPDGKRYALHEVCGSLAAARPAAGRRRPAAAPTLTDASAKIMVHELGGESQEICSGSDRTKCPDTPKDALALAAVRNLKLTLKGVTRGATRGGLKVSAVKQGAQIVILLQSGGQSYVLGRTFVAGVWTQRGVIWSPAGAGLLLELQITQAADAAADERFAHVRHLLFLVPADGVKTLTPYKPGGATSPPTPPAPPAEPTRRAPGGADPEDKDE